VVPHDKLCFAAFDLLVQAVLVALAEEALARLGEAVR